MYYYFSLFGNRFCAQTVAKLRICVRSTKS